MKLKGISNKGFRRLSRALRGQEWGGEGGDPGVQFKGPGTGSLEEEPPLSSEDEEVYTLAMSNGPNEQSEEVYADTVPDDVSVMAREMWSLSRDYAGTCKYRLYDSEGDLLDEGWF